MGEDDMKELLASGDLDNHLFNRSSAPLKAPIRRVSAPNPPGTPHDFALALHTDQGVGSHFLSFDGSGKGPEIGSKTMEKTPSSIRHERTKYPWLNQM
jgi:hypothetical protein